MAVVLCCTVPADFEDLVSNQRSKDYGCQMRLGGGTIGEAEEVREVLEAAPESYINMKNVRKVRYEHLGASSWWWPSCGEAIGAELTQNRRRVVDLAVEGQLQNCHAAEVGHRAGHASARSDWDSLLAMNERRGRCLQRRTLLPSTHSATRDRCRRIR